MWPENLKGNSNVIQDNALFNQNLNVMVNYMQIMWKIRKERYPTVFSKMYKLDFLFLILLYKRELIPSVETEIMRRWLNRIWSIRNLYFCQLVLIAFYHNCENEFHLTVSKLTWQIPLSDIINHNSIECRILHYKIWGFQ